RILRNRRLVVQPRRGGERFGCVPHPYCSYEHSAKTGKSARRQSPSAAESAFSPLFSAKSAPFSVEEVALSREVHGDAGGLRSIDRELVSNGSARLHDGLHTGLNQDLGAVREREIGIRCSDRTDGSFARALDREIARVDAVHLAHAHSDGCLS